MLLQGVSWPPVTVKYDFSGKITASEMNRELQGLSLIESMNTKSVSNPMKYP